jgi:hypothetical protein
MKFYCVINWRTNTSAPGMGADKVLKGGRIWNA